MLPQQITALLKKHYFVTIATCNLKGQPNAAPKFLLDICDDRVYFVDYVINRTWQNILKNPKVAIFVMDASGSMGYQLIGTAKILNKGPENKKMLNIFKNKIVNLSVDRIISSVRSGVKSERYEMLMSPRVTIFKIKVREIHFISPTGHVEKVSAGKVKVFVNKPIVETDIPTDTIPLLIPPALNKVKHDLEIEGK